MSDRAPSRDSDVDVAVSSKSLVAVDTIVREGRLGRLLQRFDYDVPWCRYYVLETGDPDRRFRQLDVACDPFGIGRYGDAVQLALDHGQRVDGLSTLSPAATVAYLAAKRACKGIRDEADVRELRKKFEADPAGASTLLQDVFGEPGGALARALGEASDPLPALRDVGSLIEARRRTPRRLVLRAGFGAARVLRRLARPTGLLVAVVGPDGTGKTTLADGLESMTNGLFRGTRRLHLTPGVLPPPGRLLGRRGSGDTSQPHARAAVRDRRVDRPDRLPGGRHADRVAPHRRPGESPSDSRRPRAGVVRPRGRPAALQAECWSEARSLWREGPAASRSDAPARSTRRGDPRSQAGARDRRRSTASWRPGDRSRAQPQTASQA